MGTSLAVQLKARYPRLRVLYVSGCAGDGMVKSGLLGVDEAFLAKPFSAGNGTYSLGLSTTSGTAVSLSSREGANPPQLQVTWTVEP